MIWLSICHVAVLRVRHQSLSICARYHAVQYVAVGEDMYMFFAVETLVVSIRDLASGSSKGSHLVCHFLSASRSVVGMVVSRVSSH